MVRRPSTAAGGSTMLHTHTKTHKNRTTMARRSAASSHHWPILIPRRADPLVNTTLRSDPARSRRWGSSWRCHTTHNTTQHVETRLCWYWRCLFSAMEAAIAIPPPRPTAGESCLQQTAAGLGWGWILTTYVQGRRSCKFGTFFNSDARRL